MIDPQGVFVNIFKRVIIKKFLIVSTLSAFFKQSALDGAIPYKS